MKSASFILRLKLYLELAKTSGLAVLALCPGLSARCCPTAVYVCSRCLSMLGHSGINIASGFSNIHLSTRACDFVYHICSHVQRHFVFYVEELPNSTIFIQNYNFKFCSQRIVPFNETQCGVSDFRLLPLNMEDLETPPLVSHLRYYPAGNCCYL